jgi:broad specificity phosphatase PhoE
MTTTDEVLAAALGLSVEDRAILAERLLESLEDLDDREADRLWAEEAARRLDGWRAGTPQVRSADEVYARAEQLLPD